MKCHSIRSQMYLYFNPRTRVGCDLSRISITFIYIVFQSAHPCGVRSFIIRHFLPILAFQSAHPCGVRYIKTVKALGLHPFQSAHPCGVRCLENFDLVGRFKFQSAHPCGVRLSSHVQLQVFQQISIRAPVWGAMKNELICC